MSTGRNSRASNRNYGHGWYNERFVKGAAFITADAGREAFYRDFHGWNKPDRWGKSRVLVENKSKMKKAWAKRLMRSFKRRGYHSVGTYHQFIKPDLGPPPDWVWQRKLVPKGGTVAALSTELREE